MQERRRHPRKDLMSYSQVFEAREGYLIGYLGDLNAIGAMVITDEKISPDTETIIRIHLPELKDITENAITVQVRVAWCQPDLSPEYFNIGLEFKGLTSRQLKIIEAVVEHYEFRRHNPGYPTHPNELNIAE